MGCVACCREAWKDLTGCTAQWRCGPVVSVRDTRVLPDAGSVDGIAREFGVVGSVEGDAVSPVRPGARSVAVLPAAWGVVLRFAVIGRLWRILSPYTLG